jgi:cobalt-zinc-cadmium resistance protein CzcA
MMNRLQKIYQPLLQKAIKIKYIIVSATAAVFLIQLLSLKIWVVNLFLSCRKEILLSTVFCHREVHLSQSIETSMQASRIIKQFDEVKMVVGKPDLLKFLQTRCLRKLQI